jgi:hypothetical protein
MSLTLGPTVLRWRGGAGRGSEGRFSVRAGVDGASPGVGSAGMSWLVGWVQPPIGRRIACAVWAMTPSSPGISMLLITKVVPLLSCLNPR